MTIDKLPSNNWIYSGLIGTTSASQNSYSDPTSFGWAGSNQVYVAGVNNSWADGWTGFTEGECLHFLLEGAKLTMFSVIKNKRFVIDTATGGDKFIHFNFGKNSTKVTLEPLDAEHRAKLVD